MKTTTFTVKIWRWLSIVALLITVGYGYSLLPNDVGVHFDQFGEPDQMMSKSNVFYIIFGVIMFNNVLLMAFGNMVLERPVHKLPIPHQAAWSQNADDLKEHIKNWFYAIIAAVNSLTVFTFGILATINNEFKFNIHSFDWLLYAAVALLIGILIALPIRLMIRPKED